MCCLLEGDGLAVYDPVTALLEVIQHGNDDQAAVYHQGTTLPLTILGA